MKISPVVALLAAALLLSCAGAPKAPAAPAATAPAQAAGPAADAAAPAPAPAEAPADATSAASEEASEESAAPDAAAEPAPDPAAIAAERVEYAAATLEALSAYAGASKDCAAALGAAYDLAAAGKWKSAYDGLVAFDKASADPFILAMRLDLVMGGALRSDMHQSFALKDLGDTEVIDSLRQTEGEYELFAFDPAALAAALSGTWTRPPAVLSKLLGDYWYEVRSYFGGQWLAPDEEIEAKCLENYAAAYSAGRKDAETIGRQIELLAASGRKAEAEPLLRTLIAMTPGDASLKLNLAQLLLELGRSAEGLAALDEAIAAYGDAPDRLQALAVGARKSAELGNLPAYERYMGLVDDAMPGNPTPDLLRHLISVERGWDAKAAEVADKLVAAYADPQVVRTLVSTWYGAEKGDAAKAFLERRIAAAKDESGTAVLHFYLAVLLAQDLGPGSDPAAALASLDKAEALFKKTAAPDDEIFGSIEQVRQGIAAATAPAAEEPAAAPASP